MTVDELIALLQQYDPALQVVVSDDEGNIVAPPWKVSAGIYKPRQALDEEQFAALSDDEIDALTDDDSTFDEVFEAGALTDHLPTLEEHQQVNAVCIWQIV